MNSTIQKPMSSGTIMIVDDEPNNLNVLEATLTHAGYRVVLFPRGDLALVAAREECPDLVLLDIRMSDMDGYEVCRCFKADESLCQIPIIFISALSETEDIISGFECGGVDYIAKPFCEPEVLARVRTHIALYQAHVKIADQYEQLQALEQYRDTLVHTLVHDMRSPLTVMLGHMQIIEKYGAKNLDTNDLKSLHAAIHGTRILNQMVSTIVGLSRMENEKIPLQQVAISAHEIFQAACVQSLNPSTSRAIAEHIMNHCPLLFCDVDLSVRVVINLLVNALKYAPGDSEIVLGAELDSKGVKLWVRDRGPGIPVEFKEMIFDKFVTGKQPAGSCLPSTGLGLNFCKLAVEAQGGTIGVESELGKGSTFWFTLPAYAIAPTEQTTMP